MTNSEIILTKLDAAKRQLETAVRLYFNDADPVSIHTLVCASHEILTNLNEKRGNSPTIISDNLIKEPYKKMVRDKIREAKNFFKHADKDPDGVLKFYPAVNDFFLLDSCETYEILTGEKVPHFIIFRGWFNSRYPDILNTESSEIVRNEFRDNKLRFYSAMIAASSELK